MLTGVRPAEPESLPRDPYALTLAPDRRTALAAGRLSEQFGLERRASRLGLSRFSIDPTVGVAVALLNVVEHVRVRRADAARQLERWRPGRNDTLAAAVDAATGVANGIRSSAN